MIKYSLPYRSQDDTAWQVNISTAAYSGSPIILRGVGGQACTIEQEPDTTDDPYSPFIQTSCTLTVYNQENIDIKELQNAQDTDFIVEVYRAGNLRWKGYMIPDGIQSPMKRTPQITLNCTDGLSLLEKLPFSNNNIPGLTSAPTRCPMNYIRQILFSTNNLGLPLPIHWTNTLECTAFPGEDVFTESVTWSARGEGFSYYQDGVPNRSCFYILEGIMKSMQCRLVQDHGRWVIRRINDIVTGTFESHSIAADLGIMTVTTETINANKVIGSTGYLFMNEDQDTLVRNGVKSCKVIYEAYVRENIIPNGNQDIISLAYPIYWGILGDATFISVAGIDGRDGRATQITNPVGGIAAENYTLSSPDPFEFHGGIPVDAYTLVKRLNFGFVFSPQLGFTYDTVTGIIDYSNDPMQIKITYQRPGAAPVLYLDEFAIWRDAETWISIKVDGTKINDVIQIDFNRNNSILLPKPAAPLTEGDQCKVYVDFKVKDGQQYTLDYIHFGIDENNDVYEAEFTESKNTDIDERTLQISTSYGGYMLSNYMTYWNYSNVECWFKDGDFYTGTLTGVTAQAIIRNLYKSSVIYNGTMNVRGDDWSFDTIYTIETLTGKFLPLSATYNTETNQVNLIAIECRNDDITLNEKHYGSNDQQLSN